MNPPATPRLKNLAPDLWVVDDKFPFPKGLTPVAIPAVFGKCGIRMTVVRAARGLILHSPVTYSKALHDEIAALGPITDIVGPNVVHTTFLRTWSKAIPAANLVVAPKTAKRLPVFADVPVLSDESPLAPGDLEQRLIEGNRLFETLFFHPKTKTLIVTDLAYGISKRAGILEKVWFYGCGVRNPLGLAYYSKKQINDAKFWESLKRVEKWDFDRVILSHGDIVERGGRSAFFKAWDSKSN